jgi:hypothetical protein
MLRLPIYFTSLALDKRMEPPEYGSDPTYTSVTVLQAADNLFQQLKVDRNVNSFANDTDALHRSIMINPVCLCLARWRSLPF